MTKPHDILKISLLDIFQTEHFALRLQVYLWFPEFLKVEWEAEPSVIRYLSWLNQLPVYVRDTLSTFKIRLKTFLFEKAHS